ncbi:HTH-type transcriptional repressor YtrA [Pirellulimonas nuda]|uniref:HTH-type transcriptional repressor YtrA n=1 Tax=Pirellulimonas nuda TaxID=2528009 RepID=A0A518DJQ3_9BACT|nr:GntR family transcriptional regulator [Pirellulimonas nuda]QDU91703.1 HTH-type transcriptional repressor YtrA [Pirellulimonas nuda]
MDAQPCQFDIRPSAGTPIYLQVVEQVHALVAGGRLRAGDLLPSVRQVAQAADVNPMTVSKAYSRLEAEGVVERVRGQGMRVLPTTGTGTAAERQLQLRELLAPALHRAAQLGLTEKQLRHVIDAILKEYQP